jgi:uncharacterized protein YfaS (alpha-2-macroglobulin family)
LQPHLLTGRDGTATIEFTVPDSVTAWDVFVQAVTRDLRTGTLRKEVRTARDLLVRPYLPRFLREGDQARLRVVVTNARKAPLRGEVALDVTDPETGQSLLADFGLNRGTARRPFTAAAGGGTSVVFPLAAPRRQFSTEEPPAQGSGDLFQVSRRYFLRAQSGKDWVLKPLGPGTVLKPGDEVEVELTLSAREPAEYVHLRDPRPAGLEPEDARSGWHWNLGSAWYEETRDSATNFFFEVLPAGEHTLRYRLRANLAGEFRVGPATVQSMYAPEFAAYSGAAVVRVGE